MRSVWASDKRVWEHQAARCTYANDGSTLYLTKAAALSGKGMATQRVPVMRSPMMKRRYGSGVAPVFLGARLRLVVLTRGVLSGQEPV